MYSCSHRPEDGHISCRNIFMITMQYYYIHKTKCICWYFNISYWVVSFRITKFVCLLPPHARFYLAKNRPFVSSQFIVNLLMCPVRPKVRTAVNMLAVKLTRLRPILKQRQLLVAFEHINIFCHLL